MKQTKKEFVDRTKALASEKLIRAANADPFWLEMRVAEIISPLDLHQIHTHNQSVGLIKLLLQDDMNQWDVMVAQITRVILREAKAVQVRRSDGSTKGV